jgi:hypothetical protein
MSSLYGKFVAPERACTMCGRPAQLVAADRDGLEWFECGRHNAFQNIAGVQRVRFMSIKAYFLNITRVRYRCAASDERLGRLRMRMVRLHSYIPNRQWSDLKASINWVGKEISHEFPEYYTSGASSLWTTSARNPAALVRPRGLGRSS